MTARPEALPEVAVVYEVRPGYSEGWCRVTRERRPDGPVVVYEGHNYRRVLDATPLVVEDLKIALDTVTTEELSEGRVVLGPVGIRILERLSRAPRIAA